MLVATYHSNRKIVLDERPVPVIGDGELLVKVRESGICGTDVMEWYRIKKAPRVLGHEIAGEVVEVGKGVTKFNKGDRVFVSHHVPCNDCKYCRDGNHTACETLHTGNYDPGGFSEFVRVPKINVESGTYLLPENVSFTAGTMVEPLGCVLRGQRMIGVKKGQIVLVLGSGVSGLMNIQIAKLAGAQVIATDIDEYRLQKAAEFGADEVIDARLPFGVKADRVIVCTGAHQAVGHAFNCIDRKGIILFFAIPPQDVLIPIVDFWRNELTVTSSYGAAPEDLDAALVLLSSGKYQVDKLISHTLPLNEIQKGFDLVASAKESLKVVLLPFN